VIALSVALLGAVALAMGLADQGPVPPSQLFAARVAVFTT